MRYLGTAELLRRVVGLGLACFARAWISDRCFAVFHSLVKLAEPPPLFEGGRQKYKEKELTARS